ncbi:MAG TPA: hypothetical protein VII47_15760, partial [Actinomycetota bacterium]
MAERAAAQDLSVTASSSDPPSSVHPNIGAALASLLGDAPAAPAGARLWAQTSAPQEGRVVDTFAVLPSTSDPRLLVSTRSRPAAAAALRQHTNATSRRLWLKAEAMAWAMRLGAGGRIARGRLSVLAEEGYEGALPLKELLSEIFEQSGGGPIELAVRLGPLRPNRKPVIQILRPDGTVLGYAKVSRTDLTARLVHNEGVMLARVAEAGPRTFQVPTVLHAGLWAGMQILVVGPLPRRRMALGGTDARMPVAATRELAELFGTTRQALASSPHWQSTLARIAGLPEPGGLAATSLAEAAGELERRHGPEELSIGSWHGDWTPSNMARGGRHLCVWDWERSGSGKPVGMDAGHFGFHIARKVGSLAPKPAAAATLQWLPGALEAMGLEGRHAALMLSLALLEMAVRFQEARAEGVEVTDPAYLGAL